MNPAVILALIADLYQQVGALAEENERLRAAVAQTPPPGADSTD